MTNTERLTIMSQAKAMANHRLDLLAAAAELESLTARVKELETLERLIVRLATRGLLPCEHNLQIWQHADNSGWGASVEVPYKVYQAEAHGETLQAALEALMNETNRGADAARKQT